MYIQGQNDLAIGTEEAVKRLRTALRTCTWFKKTFYLYEKRVAAANPSRTWTFSASSIFSLLDSFMERCHDLLDLTNTIIQVGQNACFLLSFVFPPLFHVQCLDH